MSADRRGHALLPTDGIKDIQVRNFLDRLVEAWDEMHYGDDKVVTSSEFERLAANAIGGALGPGVIGGANGTTGKPGAITVAIDNLADSIKKSLLYQVLSTQIQPIDVDRLRMRIDGVMQKVTAGLHTEVTFRREKDYAVASAVNHIWAQIGGSDAVIEDGELAAATPSTAVATKWNQVQAAVTDPNTGQVSSGAILEETRAYADANEGAVHALYTVRAQISHGGQTLVGGFGLAASATNAEGPRIDFGVLANRFWIGAPASSYDPAAEYGANTQFPFIVVTTPTTINGVTYPAGVYMKKALIGQASIDNAMIGQNIYSSNFNGTFDGSGNISGYGSAGWAISKDGQAVFNNVKVRGDVEANSITANSVNTTNIVGSAVTGASSSTTSGLTTSLSVSVPSGTSCLLIMINWGGGYQEAVGEYYQYHEPTGSLSINSSVVLSATASSSIWIVTAPSAGTYLIELSRGSFNSGDMQLAVLVNKR